MKRVVATVFFFVVLLCFPTRAEEAVLFAEGELRVMIVLPAEPEKLERLAAKELADHLEAITGKRPEIAMLPLKRTAPVVVTLGELSAAHRQALVARSPDPGSFALVVRKDRIAIGGVGPIGTCHGVYESLEQLGVRWYMPGALGTVLPPGDRLALAEQETLQAPSFVSRAVGGTQPLWHQRNRMGGISPPSTLSFPAPAPFAEQPELYALVGGERHAAQLCVSNPETLRLEIEVARAYFRAKPEAVWMPVSNHGEGHCECAGCRALDPPERLVRPFTGGININDRYVWFCNRMLDALADEFPDKRLAMTVCTPQFQPPAHIVGHPNLDILAWANGFCRLHGVNNPACPQRQEVLAMETQWVKVLQGHFYERTNWGNIAGPGLPLPAVHRYREDFPAYHRAGIKGVRGADYSHLISQLPSSYIGARLLWNVDADVDALLADFYRRFYGPAEAPMRAYHELLERTVRDAPCHAGTSVDFPRVYPPEMRQQARAALTKAQELATDSPWRDRLAAIALDLDYLDAYCAMIAARDRADFVAAHDGLARCRAIIARLQTEYTPPLLNRSFAPNYLDLFFGKAIEDGWRKTTAEGRLAVALQPVWQFRLDPQGVGDREQWFRPDAVGDAWQPQSTWTSSWASEGLGDYEGFAWYRQRFALPAGDDPLRLWFGGIDEQATVWLNGKPIGTFTGAFKPFELDATEAAIRGGENALVVRIGNLELNEVGTGGLLAPVILYTPAATENPSR